MSFESAISFFLACFVFSVTPGPGCFAVIAQSLTRGMKPALTLACGMILSDVLYLLAACMGLSVIATQWELAFNIIRWCGAAYLLYLGWGMWNTKHVDAAEAKASQKSASKLFSQGFLISVSNPKVILFYIAFLPTFMDLTALTANDIGLAVVLNMLALFAGQWIIALFASRAKSYFQSEKGAERLNKGAGSIMMTAGVFLATR